MRHLIIFLIFCTGCGGGLSERQRNSIKEEMGNREIKKVRENEIMTSALEKGREAYKKLINSSNPDSLAGTMNLKQYTITENSNIDNELEFKIYEAYDYSAKNGVMLSDNIQRDGEELIYTVPYIEDELFKGVFVIRMKRKEVVLGLN